jgi:hypothetical protein
MLSLEKNYYYNDKTWISHDVMHITKLLQSEIEAKPIIVASSFPPSFYRYLHLSRHAAGFVGFLCLVLGLVHWAAADENDTLFRWSSTGGGWRSMFAWAGFANTFQQAGLLTEDASLFSAIVSDHHVICRFLGSLSCANR